MNGWYVWDRDTNNAVGYYATNAEATDALQRVRAANPAFVDDFVMFEDPTTPDGEGPVTDPKAAHDRAKAEREKPEHDAHGKPDEAGDADLEAPDKQAKEKD